MSTNGYELKLGLKIVDSSFVAAVYEVLVKQVFFNAFLLLSVVNELCCILMSIYLIQKRKRLLGRLKIKQKI